MDTVVRPDDSVPVGFPVLMRTARKTYAWAIRGALTTAGLEGIPHNGIYILLGIAKNGPSAAQLVRELSITKQAASSLIDILVENEYVVRREHDSDRRRRRLELTEKGRFAAELAQKAIDGVNQELLQLVGADNIQTAKYVLAVLIDINDGRHNLPRGIR